MARRSKKSFAAGTRCGGDDTVETNLASAAKKVAAVSPMARLGALRPPRYGCGRPWSRDRRVRRRVSAGTPPSVRSCWRCCARLHVLRQGIVEPGGDLTDAGAECARSRFQTGAEIDIAHIPRPAGVQQILNRGAEAELQLTVDLVIERINRVVQPIEAVGSSTATRPWRGGHVGIGLVDQAAPRRPGRRD